MSQRTVIVGAGPGGLSISLLLAHAGHKVTLLERQPYVGGRTSGIHEKGYHWDRGPTFFLYPRVLSEILASVGRDLETEVPMTRLDPQYRLMFGAGGQLDATPNVEEMERQIQALAPNDSGGFTRFLQDNRGKLERFRTVLERPFSGVMDLLKWDMLKALPKLRPHKSLSQDLGRYFSDDRIRLAFSFQSKYLGMSPFRCPSLFSILSFLEYEHGVWHPTGGCNAVMEALARIAKEMGVEIREDEAVEQLEFKGRRVTHVSTPKATYPCDSLVINSDFSRTMQSLVPDRLRRRWSDKKISKSRFSCSTFMLYLGVKGKVDLPHHTIYVSKDYEQNLKEIEERHILSADPSFYVANPCVTDPGMAPAGNSALYILVPVTHQTENIDWKTQGAQFRKQTLDRLALLGLENIEERIEAEHMMTPDDWDSELQVHLGATFNLSHNLRQMLFLRPRNRYEDLESVYLVGGGTHPGSGLPVIFESARITAGLMAEDSGGRVSDGLTMQEAAS